jgi:stringent starvation protein B
MSQEMTSARPYLLRAMHEWLSDNDQTPLMLVDATRPSVSVPPGHVKEGRIVLNVSWSATQGLEMGNDTITFSARFGGVARAIEFPVEAVLGIYSRENGQGMQFTGEAFPQGDAAARPDGAESGGSVSSSAGHDSDGDDDPDGPPDGSGPPRLRVVK